MCQIGDFVQKIAPKSCLFADTNLILPTLGGLGPPSFKVSSFLIACWGYTLEVTDQTYTSHQVGMRMWQQVAASHCHRSAGGQKRRTTAGTHTNGCMLEYSGVSHIFATFWSRRPYMGSTMWKLTSWQFGKCDVFPCSDVLNSSYGWSKSTESEILSSSSKIVEV